MPIYQKPNTSKAAKGSNIYPYLLCGFRVDHPNQVWVADITYLPMLRWFLYFVAVMDWRRRKVLVWRISNTLEAGFCVDVLNEAIQKFGMPEIMQPYEPEQRVAWKVPETVQQMGSSSPTLWQSSLHTPMPRPMARSWPRPPPIQRNRPGADIMGACLGGWGWFEVGVWCDARKEMACRTPDRDMHLGFAIGCQVLRGKANHTDTQVIAPAQGRGEKRHGLCTKVANIGQFAPRKQKAALVDIGVNGDLTLVSQMQLCRIANRKPGIPERYFHIDDGGFVNDRLDDVLHGAAPSMWSLTNIGWRAAGDASLHGVQNPKRSATRRWGHRQ